MTSKLLFCFFFAPKCKVFFEFSFFTPHTLIEVSSHLLHGGGFPSSVVPEQCGHVTLVEHQVQVIDGFPVAVGLRKASQRNANRQLRELIVTVRV